MPVFIHHSTLVINKKAVSEVRADGIPHFREKFITGGDPLYQTEDDELFALASMNSDEHEIQEMIDYGLSFDKELVRSEDFVIVDRYNGPLWPVSWLENTSSFAWHRDCDPELKHKALHFDTLPMSYFNSVFESGGNPFVSIRSW